MACYDQLGLRALVAVTPEGSLCPCLHYKALEESAVAMVT